MLTILCHKSCVAACSLFQHMTEKHKMQANYLQQEFKSREDKKCLMRARKLVINSAEIAHFADTQTGCSDNANFIVTTPSFASLFVLPNSTKPFITNVWRY